MKKITLNLILKFLFFLPFVMAVNTFAIDTEQRKKLKQEILNELLQSDVLKQHIIKEIKLYEIEKLSLQNKQKRQRQNKLTQQAKQTLRPVLPARGHIYGNPAAPVSIIEFSDFKCPYCRKIHPVLKRLVNDSDKQINWVFRHFPLGSHKPDVQQEAQASECANHLAGNKGYWQFIDALFAQPRRGQSSEQIINRASSIANIDLSELQECIQSEKFKERVNEDGKEAVSMGLRGTPANIIIHHPSQQFRLIQGSASLSSFKKEINELTRVNKN